MATDIQQILENLMRFYDFSGKRVLHIGAGGGQFLLNPELAGEIVAVDNNPAAVRMLTESIRQRNLSSRVKVLEMDFYNLELTTDVVLFEFCLHEMPDPAEALNHAGTLAGDTVVLDHSPESEWAWFGCETEKAAAAWKAAGQIDMAELQKFKTLQRFGNYQELFDKVKIMGRESIRRIARFMDQTGIAIPMA